MPSKRSAAGGPRRSRRLRWDAASNALTRAAAERRERRLPVFDLTQSNPTRVGLDYPDDHLAEILRRAAPPAYDPQPRGLPAAREALAAALSRPGDAVDPGDLVLTASTSEAYSHLFKLFADPGGQVLTGAPAYPLLDMLTALDSLSLRHFRMEPGRRRFALDPGAVARAVSPRTRLLVVVHPGNPTGSYLSEAEHRAVDALCARRGLPLVSDEVFLDYPLHAAPAPRSLAAAGCQAVTLALGGLSKSAVLPSWKLGWIRVAGPPRARRRWLAGLDLIADSYLSVSAPIQRALPELLALAPRLRAPLQQRLRANFGRLNAAFAQLPAVEVLTPEGGWSAVLRVPRVASDDELTLGLLARTGVLVHPGYFYDFPGDGYLVVSLLPEPTLFADGASRLAAHLTELLHLP